MKKLSNADKSYLLSTIRDVRDYPKPGIIFKDITTFLNDKKAFNFLLNHLKERYLEFSLDFVVGIESRGFILGAALAAMLGVGFVPVRKPKKLPYITISQKYSLEYGVDEIEMHIDAFREIKNPKILLIDDLIATGGTAGAACDLVAKIGGNLLEICFLIDLKELGGSEKLRQNHKIYSVLEV